MSEEGIITVEDVTKSFDGTRRVLDGVNVTVQPGETLVILGGSGCGKSTLLKILVGITKPDSGQVKILGRDIHQADNKEKDELRKKFGILFQSGALFNSMTLGENVALPLREHSQQNETMIQTIVKMKLDQVGLRGFENHYPAQISGGMKKRVALARAMALDPRIIFYDEPSAGLDPITTAVIDELVLKLKKFFRMTNIVVTHDLKSAFRIADRIMYLYNGRVLALGSPEEIKASKDPYVVQFIEGLPDGPIPFDRSSKDYLEDLLDLEESQL